MRLLVLSDRYPPYYEGAYELNCQSVVNELTGRGHQATVLTTTHGVGKKVSEGNVHRILSHHDFAYRSTVHRRVAQLQFFQQAMTNYRTTRRFANALQPDLVFIWQLISTSMLPVHAVQDLGLPTVFRLGGPWLINFKQWYVDEPNPIKRWYRIAANGFRRFEELDLQNLIMSGGMLRQAHQDAGIRVEHSTTILSAIPPEWIAEQPPARPRQPGSLRLLYAGRITPTKGIHIAVQALARLVASEDHAGITLDIIGRGDEQYAATLRNLVAQENLAGHVRLSGFLPREELIHRYSDYDIMVLPTLGWEGLPVTILEAMAQGTPVIASDVCGPQDVIRHGHNGLLVPPGNADALAAAITQVSLDPKRLVDMGRAGIQTVRSNHTMKRMIDQYEDYLLACMSHAAGRDS